MCAEILRLILLNPNSLSKRKNLCLINGNCIELHVDGILNLQLSSEQVLECIAGRENIRVQHGHGHVEFMKLQNETPLDGIPVNEVK